MLKSSEWSRWQHIGLIVILGFAACGSSSCDEDGDKIAANDVPAPVKGWGICDPGYGLQWYGLFYNMTADFSAKYSVHVNGYRNLTYTLQPYDMYFTLEYDGYKNEGAGCVLFHHAIVDPLLHISSNWTGNFWSPCDNCEWDRIAGGSDGYGGANPTVTSIISGGGMIWDVAEEFNAAASGFWGLVAEVNVAAILDLLQATNTSATSVQTANVLKGAVSALAAGETLPVLSFGDIAALLVEASEHGLYISTDLDSMTVTIVKDPAMRGEMVRFLNELRLENPDEVDQALVALGLNWGDLINSQTLVLPIPGVLPM